jgi:hypothetical protein
MRRGRLSLVAHGTALWKEISMPEKTAHAWEEIVTQLTQEQDRFRVVELAHKLNEAMLAEEREKVRQRLGVGRSNAA